MALLDRISGTGMVGTTQLNNDGGRVGNKENSDGPAFSLQDDGGVIYEPSTPEKPAKTLEQTKEEVRREEEAAARANMHARFDGPGVEVQLSEAAASKAKEQTAPSPTIWDRVQETWSSIKNFFISFWNGESASATADVKPEDMHKASEDATADEMSDMTERVSAIEGADISENEGYGNEYRTPEKTASDDSSEIPAENIRNLDNDPESIAAFMVDYGGRQLAKNSNLLTRYDRTGHITTPSASDQHRILQGDRNIRRY